MAPPETGQSLSDILRQGAWDSSPELLQSLGSGADPRGPHSSAAQDGHWQREKSEKQTIQRGNLATFDTSSFSSVSGQIVASWPFGPEERGNADSTYLEHTGR